MGLSLRQVELPDYAGVTRQRHLSRYLDVAIEGHRLVMQRVPTRSGAPLYEVHINEQLQPDLEVDFRDVDDEALVARAWSEWRKRHPNAAA